jgi:hypothetical protein
VAHRLIYARAFVSEWQAITGRPFSAGDDEFAPIEAQLYVEPFTRLPELGALDGRIIRVVKAGRTDGGTKLSATCALDKSETAIELLHVREE